MKYNLEPEANRILKFWFSQNNEQKWFIKDDNFDKEIRNNFLSTYNMAIQGKFDEWITIPEELLALILIFHQLPRNMFRGLSQAFETDREAVLLSKHTIRYKMDEKLIDKKYRMFVYMPLMHSESLEDQKLSLKMFKTIDKENLNYAENHFQIIQKFGRFPNRNSVLKRESSKEEEQFILKQGFNL